jgi:hypothetical protein
LFAVFFAFPAHAASTPVTDSTTVSAADSAAVMEVKVETRSSLLSVLAWPFEKLVQPTVRFLVYPFVPPVRYIARHNLIDKGVKLTTFGPQKQMFLYPSFNMRTGSSSSIGATLRVQDLLLRNDLMVFSPTLYVNGDTYFSWRYRKGDILGSGVSGNFSLAFRQDQDASLASHTYTDSSFSISYNFSRQIAGNWSARLEASLDLWRFGKPLYAGEDIVSSEGVDFDPVNLGFYQHYQEYPLGASFLYDSRNERYTTTEGSYLRATYHFVPVSRYNQNSKHSYHEMEFVAQNFLLLGRRTYEMTVRESDSTRRDFFHMDLGKAVERLQPENIRETLFERRVLVSQFRLAQSFENHAGLAPSTAWWSMGRNFPLRYYDDRKNMGLVVAGLSLEYRFPLDRLADGMLFNEYGIFAPSWSGMRFSNFRNSWGFGFQVRKPGLFITRFQLAFHGLSGMAMILTTRPTYE